MRPFTNHYGWAEELVYSRDGVLLNGAPKKYPVKCRGCGAILGYSRARLEDEPEEWKCSLCFTVTYPNTRGYRLRLEQCSTSRHD